MLLPFRRPALTFGLLMVATALAGCNTSGTSSVARTLSGGGPEPEMPEFVRASRPAEPLQHIPVGVTPPGRPTPVRSASDVSKLEKELESQRDRAKAFARRPAPGSTYDGSVPRPAKAAAGAGSPRSEE